MLNKDSRIRCIFNIDIYDLANREFGRESTVRMWKSTKERSLDIVDVKVSDNLLDKVHNQVYEVINA